MTHHWFPYLYANALELCLNLMRWLAESWIHANKRIAVNCWMSVNYTHTTGVAEEKYVTWDYKVSCCDINGVERPLVQRGPQIV